MASSSAAVAGRRAATAFSAWSLKMRKAGTPRRLASARRHRRNVSSIRESGAIPGRLDGRGGAGVATAAGFRDRLPLAGAAAFFFLPLAVLASAHRHNQSSLTCGGEALLRSEEHTSELQSLRHLVCRLLLEKK